MKGIIGLFSEIRAYVNKQKEDGNLVTNVGSLVKHLRHKFAKDISKIPRKDLEDFWLSSVAAIGLNDCGLRATIKGEGLYIDPKSCVENDLHEILVRIYNNQNDTVRDDMGIKRNLLRMLEEMKNPGQLYFDKDGNIAEASSREEMIELLKRLAGDADCG